jgi:uncharacterized coiled-coil DUF342 family protein
MDPSTVNREWVALKLVEKHEKALKVVQEEFEKYSSLEKELEAASEKHKTERDELNSRVQSLKDDRQRHYTESRNLRKEFTTKMGKKKEMSEIPMEVMILTKQIDQLEWEIQTEALSIDVEKRMVKQIQDNLEKLHHYADMYQEHEEVSVAVKNLAGKLNQRLRLAQRKHLEMLEAVKTSDDRHKKFVDAIMKLRDARAKRVGFQHDMERHEKGIEHWQKVAENEAKKTKKNKSQNRIPQETKTKLENLKNGDLVTDVNKSKKQISEKKETTKDDLKNLKGGGVSNGQ